MSKLSAHEIRRRFESSKEFNEIFDAFEQALHERLEDIELYRALFWNPSLSADELCLFGEKIVIEFPGLAYDTYMWLANVFEVTYSTVDNYERALEYYEKASSVHPQESAPYLDAADCYEPDLNIPPLSSLINFLKAGIEQVSNPKVLYERLSHLYDLDGNDEMSNFCRRKAEEGTEPPAQQPSPG